MKIKVYKVKVSGLSGPVVWDSIDDVIEDLRSQLSLDIGDVITIAVEEMEEEDYNSLPEFRGF